MSVRRGPRHSRQGLRVTAGLVVALSHLVACRDLSRFSTTGGGKYEGSIAAGAFVRSGFSAAVTACLTLDTDHLQDAPGSISTSDGRFSHATLRPIPELWNDPLSTLNFGEGRVKNLVYVARPNADAGAASDAGNASDGTDVMVIVSLLQSSDVEVRMLRGAPMDATGSASAANADAGTETSSRLFGVFGLSRGDGACSY